VFEIVRFSFTFFLHSPHHRTRKQGSGEQMPNCASSTDMPRAIGWTGNISPAPSEIRFANENTPASHEAPLGAPTGCGFPKGSDPPATPWNCAIWIPPPEQAYRLFFAGAEMAKRERWQGIPTELNLERFREFVLPHLSVGSRGLDTKLSLHVLFNYILKQLYLGCQWKARQTRV
jgi:hypothetical protein